MAHSADAPHGTPADQRVDGSSAPDRRTNAQSRVARRAAVQRHLQHYRLEEFGDLLATLAAAVFGPQATVVAHLRNVGGAERLTFVVDAASPAATVDYREFLPFEQAFWTAYAQIPKPTNVAFMVAIRPARGWSRAEALAPLFAWLPTQEGVS